MHDKTFWEAILAAQGQPPESQDIGELTAELLDYLRSPDPVLRDRFAFQILTNWIIKGQYDASQLRVFFNRWIADLTTGIGANDSDSLPIRSFAALMLSMLVYRDIQAPYLTDAEVQTLLDAILRYLADEKDLRGYDCELGWLHATAHSADVLKFLARNPKTSADHLLIILRAITNKVIAKTGVTFAHGEDERLSLAVLDVLKRNLLSQEQLTAWVDTFSAVHIWGDVGIELDTHAYSAYLNTKYFLRALSMRIAYAEDLPGAHNLADTLHNILRNFLK